MAIDAQTETRTFSPVKEQTFLAGAGERVNWPIPTPEPVTQSEPLKDPGFAAREKYGQVQVRAFGQGSEKRTFNEFQTFHFFLEDADAEVWDIVGPFGIETHAENEDDVKTDIDDYLCFLWRTYVESDEPMTNEAMRLRNELLQAVCS